MQFPAALLSDLANTGTDLSRYIIVCTVLVGAVLFLAWLFRRFLAGELSRRASKRSLQVMDVLPLGGRQKLMVVRCYDRSFLLGVGDKEVRSLAELDPEAILVPEPPKTPVSVTVEEVDSAPAARREFIEELQKELPIPRPDAARPEKSVLQEGLLG